MDSITGNTNCDELVTRRFPHVQEPMTWSRTRTRDRRIHDRFASLRNEPPAQIVFRKSCRYKSTSDIGADLVATRSNRGPNHGDHVRGMAVKLTHQSGYGHRGNLERQAAPSGVRGGHG